MTSLLIPTEKKCTIAGDGVHTGIHTSIYPGRKLGPGVSTLPGEIVKPDLKQVIVCGIIAYTGI